jgi:hypothetical protein
MQYMTCNNACSISVVYKNETILYGILYFSIIIFVFFIILQHCEAQRPPSKKIVGWGETECAWYVNY